MELPAGSKFEVLWPLLSVFEWRKPDDVTVAALTSIATTHPDLTVRARAIRLLLNHGVPPADAEVDAFWRSGALGLELEGYQWKALADRQRILQRLLERLPDGTADFLPRALAQWRSWVSTRVNAEQCSTPRGPATCRVSGEPPLSPCSHPGQKSLGYSPIPVRSRADGRPMALDFGRTSRNARVRWPQGPCRVAGHGRIHSKALPPDQEPRSGAAGHLGFRPMAPSAWRLPFKRSGGNWSRVPACQMLLRLLETLASGRCRSQGATR